MTNTLQHKPVLITGCSSGIGHYAAQALQQRGYRVFATARKQPDVAALQQAGFESFRLDVTDTPSIHEAVELVLNATNGQLYGLFNNAGYGQPGAVEDLTRAALRAQFETNLFGMVELTNLIIPVMRRQGYGRIIQNSSILGFTAMPFRGAYNASKFAMEGITDTLRLELRGTGIYLSLIEPGPIESKFRANALAAFNQHIDRDRSLYRERYAVMEKRLAVAQSTTPFTLPPAAVFKKLLHALESPRPKARYPVTVPTHFFTVVKRLLPTVVLDWIILRAARREGSRRRGSG